MTARAVLTLFHRYAGLALAGFLTLAGLTGSVIAFQDELDSWLNPQLYRTASAGAPLAVDELVEKIEHADARLRVRGFSLRPEPGHALVVGVEPALDSRSGEPFALDFDEIFVDPVDARVLGRREWGVCCLQRERLIPFLYSLHYSLHLPGRTGVIIMGIVALAWAVDCFVAFALTLPRGGPFWRRWRAAWRIERGASRYRLYHDTHQASGLWAWAILLVIAVSGLAMNLPDQVFRPALALFSKLTPTPLEQGRAQLSTIGERRIGFGAAIASARDIAQKHGWPTQPSYVFYARTERAYGVGFVREGEDPETGLGASWVYVNHHDSRLLATELMGSGSAGDVFAQAQFPLHSGRLLGLPGRILISATGLIVAVLSVTGVYIWAVKRAARERATAISPRSSRALPPS